MISYCLELSLRFNLRKFLAGAVSFIIFNSSKQSTPSVKKKKMVRCTTRSSHFRLVFLTSGVGSSKIAFAAAATTSTYWSPKSH